MLLFRTLFLHPKMDPKMGLPTNMNSIEFCLGGSPVLDFLEFHGPRQVPTRPEPAFPTDPWPTLGQPGQPLAFNLRHFISETHNLDDFTPDAPRCSQTLPYAPRRSKTHNANGCMDGWMYGCMDVWMDVWMYGWMYGCL